MVSVSAVSRETMQPETIRIFEKQVESWGLSLCPAITEDLLRYVRILCSYGEANVVGTREPRAVLLDHVLDSLSCFLFRPLLRASSLIDVGAGAGLPGMPLKLVNLGMRLSLVESTRKKTVFMERAIEALALDRTNVINARAEEIGRQPEHRSMYEVATARALAALPVVAEYGMPLVRLGGYVIAMKGSPAPEELKAGERAADMLGARLSEVIEVPLLPELRVRRRCLVVFQKVADTPETYPRRPGTAKKRPLR